MGANSNQCTMARNHVKTKSASVEANNYPSIRCSSINLFEDTGYHLSPSISSRDDLSVNDSIRTNLLAIAPSVSTSCLFLASEHESTRYSPPPSPSPTPSDTKSNNNEDQDERHREDCSTNTALVCIPTRASLTHEWKKLKTPNKCRECNLLVYFNGRECSFCGFIAHKKCVSIMVIKCSGQKLARGLLSGKFKSKESQQKQQNLKPDNSQCDTRQPATKSPSSQLNSFRSQISFRRTKSSPPQTKPIFGQPIEDGNDQVIDFIRRFIYEIDTRGLASRGIYRVSSIKSKVDRLCNYYDQNLSNLVDLTSFHPNIIANALKMYLRQLPEPLLTDELYNRFIDLAKKYPTPVNNDSNQSHKTSRDTVRPPPILIISESPQSIADNTLGTHYTGKRMSIGTRIEHRSIARDPSYDPQLIAELKDLTDELPRINRDLIAIIMRHLKRVANMSNENQMSAKNLSIIFGPTLLSSSNKSLAIVDNIHQARIVELMITWANQIFPQYANYESTAVIELDLPGD